MLGLALICPHLSLVTGNIPSSWNSFLCNKSGKTQRTANRKKSYIVVKVACLLHYTALATVLLRSGGPKVCRHGSMHSVTVNNIRCWWEFPLQLAVSHQWPTTICWVTKTQTPKHKRKIYQLPTTVAEMELSHVCVKQKERKRGWDWERAQ